MWWSPWRWKELQSGLDWKRLWAGEGAGDKMRGWEGDLGDISGVRWGKVYYFNRND